MPFGIITAGLLGGLLSTFAKGNNSRIVGGAAKRKPKNLVIRLVANQKKTIQELQ